MCGPKLREWKGPLIIHLTISALGKRMRRIADSAIYNSPKITPLAGVYEGWTGAACIHLCGLHWIKSGEEKP